MKIYKKNIKPLAGALLLLMPGLSQASSPKDGVASKTDTVIQKLIGQSNAPSKKVNVIVRLKGPLGAKDTKMIADLSGDVYRHLDLIHSVAASFPQKNLKRLLVLPFVEHVS